MDSSREHDGLLFCVPLSNVLVVVMCSWGNVRVFCVIWRYECEQENIPDGRFVVSVVQSSAMGIVWGVKYEVGGGGGVGWATCTRQQTKKGQLVVAYHYELVCSKRRCFFSCFFFFFLPFDRWYAEISEGTVFDVESLTQKLDIGEEDNMLGLLRYRAAY